MATPPTAATATATNGISSNPQVVPTTNGIPPPPAVAAATNATIATPVE